MSEFIVDETTAATPIGELLRRAADGPIKLHNAAGEAIGWIAPPSPPVPLLPLTEDELAELRKRCDRDRSEYLTRTELLARLHALTANDE